MRQNLDYRASISTCLFLAAVSLVLAPQPLARAQYDLSWHTVDAGGGTFSAGGNFTLGGTAGQPDAGSMSGGQYTLAGGFWFDDSPCHLVGDLDLDGDVDLTDLATLLAHFGTPSGATLAEGDVDGDGAVDLTDLASVLAVFGTSCP